MMSKVNKPLVSLSILILASALVIFFPYIFGNRLFVFTDLNMDTYLSYIPSYELLVGRISRGAWLPFDFTIGLGMDSTNVVASFFNPFSAISIIIGVIFGKATIAYSLVVVQILQIVFCGIVCYKYISLFSEITENGKIVASYCFAFSGYIIGACQHYHFLILVFYLIVGIYLVERFVRKMPSIIPFILLVTLTALNGIYNLYILSLFLSVYFIVRLIQTNNRFMFKDTLMSFLKLLISYLLGVLNGAVILLPTSSLIINSGRIDGELSLLDRIISSFSWISLKEAFVNFSRSISENFLGTANNYHGIQESFSDLHIYFGIIILFCIPLFIYSMIKGKKNKSNVIICIVTVAIIFSLTNTFIGCLNHVFAYMTYRFSFVITPLFALLIAKYFEKLQKPNKIEYVLVTLVSTFLIIFSILFVENQDTVAGKGVLINIVISAVLILVLITFSGFICKSRKSNTVISIMLMAVIMGNIVVDSFISVNSDRYTWQKDTYETTHDNANVDLLISSVKNTEKDNFYRMEVLDNLGNVISPINYSFMKEYRSTSVYSSITSPQLSEFKHYFGNENAHISLVNWYKAGSFGEPFNKVMADLLGIKYIISDKEVSKSDWNLIGSNQYNLYLNKNVSSCGTKFYNYISKNDFLALTPLEQKIILAQAIVVNDDVELGINKISAPIVENLDSIFEIPSNGSNKTLDVWIDSLKYENKKANIEMSSYDNGKIIFDFKSNLNPEMINMLYFDFSSYTSSTMRIVQYADGEQLLSDEMYTGENVSKSIELNIDPNCHKMEFVFSTGSFSLNDFYLFSYQQMYQTNGVTFENKNYEGVVCGTVETDRPCIFMLPIEKADHWNVLLNNQKVETILADFAFTGIVLEDNENEIAMNYNNWYFSFGLIISLIGIAFTFILIVVIISKNRIIERRKK